MDKLDPIKDGASKDILEENVQELKKIFPEVVTEGKIDFEKLKETLGEYVENREERYNFTWNGKSEARRLAQTLSMGTLRPCPGESVDWEKTENLFIEGDNLEVLKLLQKSYHKKIKMIYIDPPYNTGSQFIYPDDFKDNIKNYLELTDQTDEDGRKLSVNPETSGRYHTDWLNMMYPRLKLARNLLTDDGVIFISIDDNEVSNLRKICDEIFGEENLLSIHHIQVRYGQKSLNERKDFQELIEYVFIYSKNKREVTVNKPEEEYPVEKFSLCIQHDEEPTKTVFENCRKIDVWTKGNYSIKKVAPGIESFKETWISGSILTGTGHGSLYQKCVDSRIDNDGYDCLYRIHGIGEDGLGYRYFTNPKKSDYTRGKMYTKIPIDVLKKVKEGTAKKSSPIINFYDFSGDFGNIRNEGDTAFNAGKKPVKMLKQFLNYITNDDFIVLDFFSGSSSTAHAVIQLNAEDNGNRKFIMVQLPEPCDEKSEAYKEGYKTIAEIGKERIRRVIKKIETEEETKDRDNLFKSKETKDNKQPDLGFKVFKLDSSNIKPWEAGFDNLDESLFDAVENIKPERSESDVLYELLLKYGLDLTVPIESRNIDDKTVYIIGAGALIVCLADNISLDVVEGIARLKNELKPELMRVVFKDAGFKDDVVKTNTVQILRQHGIEDVKSI